MIDIAECKANELKVDNVEYNCITLFDKTLEKEPFDVILAFNILHFFKNTKEVIQRINDLLKPNGIVIIAADCLGQWSFSNVLQRFFFTPLIWIGIIPYMKFFKILELNRILGKSSFQIMFQEQSSKSTNNFIVAKKTINVI